MKKAHQAATALDEHHHTLTARPGLALLVLPTSPSTTALTLTAQGTNVLLHGRVNQATRALLHAHDFHPALRGTFALDATAHPILDRLHSLVIRTPRGLSIHGQPELLDHLPALAHAYQEPGQPDNASHHQACGTPGPPRPDLPPGSTPRRRAR